MQTKYLCVLIHIWIKGEVGNLKRFKPSSNCIFTDRSKGVLLLWVVFVGCASCWCVLFFVALWSPAGKGLTSWLSCMLCFVISPNASWSTSESRVRLAPWNWFKPSSKIFYWPFQGGTSFLDLYCFCSVLCLLCLCARLFICALWSPAGKGLTSWLSFVVSAVSLSLSHWYPGSGVVLDCIDSWSCTLNYFYFSFTTSK